jgi:HD-GYP domain-containing protein (c-di-GMP phosphodiesterase class II)
MSSGRKHSLHTFIHRTLLLRLALAGTVLALLIGGLAYLAERDRLGEAAIDFGYRRTELFAARYAHLFADPDNLDGKAIREAARQFRESRDDLKAGEFVFVRVFNADGKAVTDLLWEQYAHTDEVKEVAASWPSQLPVDKPDQREIVEIAGKPHLRFRTPILDTAGKTLAFSESVFAFSEESLRDFRRRGLRALFWVVAVVLLTTAILYPVILTLTRRISDFSVRLLQANMETLETLGSAIAQKDSDTNAHNYRVSIYATRIGEEVGLPARTMRTLIKGSFLHDVGKIGIPDRILLKPGRLDKDEFEVMKTHVVHGREIVERSQWLHDAMEVVLSHHEKMSGEGYPAGLGGPDIPVTARIFAIADVFDALTSKRPYKDPWPFDKAMEILEEGRGMHFDPDLLDAFARVAPPLYERYGGKEEVFREDLEKIIHRYFDQGMDSLEY